jgi:hypothetical protein
VCFCSFISLRVLQHEIATESYIYCLVSVIISAVGDDTA